MLQAHTDDKVAQEHFNCEISSVLSDVKGTFRTTVSVHYFIAMNIFSPTTQIFTSVGAKKKSNLHGFVTDVYLKRCLGTPGAVPTAIFGHFAFLVCYFVR
jgi:hypothetical protein